MGNKGALAASAKATAAKAFSSQSNECEIAAERCSLRSQGDQGRSARPLQDHVQPSRRSA